MYKRQAVDIGLLEAKQAEEVEHDEEYLKVEQQYPYPASHTSNSSFRTFNTDELPETEEPEESAVDIGLLEAKQAEEVEHEEEYSRLERTRRRSLTRTRTPPHSSQQCLQTNRQFCVLCVLDLLKDSSS